MKIIGKKSLLKYLRVHPDGGNYSRYFENDWKDMPCTRIYRGKGTAMYAYDSEKVLEFLEKRFGADEFDIWGLLELAGKHRPI